MKTPPSDTTWRGVSQSKAKKTEMEAQDFIEIGKDQS
jgi:hypothetical protein